ncbi:MAG: RNA polymerase factor sigma-54 [Firmicutes bacterium]|nr:RNA polymerase factor sigma-54 [Bacillota bacterium]
MRLGYDLTIEQAQKLVMTPELIQAIQILQFNTQELEAYVDEQVLVNPILEIDPQLQEPETTQLERTKAGESEFDWAEHFKEREYDDISYKEWQYRQNQDTAEYSFEQFISTDVSLTENLMVQLQFVPLKKGERLAAKYIIEALDENGYLTQPLEEVGEQFRLTEGRMEEILAIIQGFDPIGVGARDLKECLKIQLRHQGNDDELMLQVVDDHLEDIANNRLSNIARALTITIREAQEISDVIRKLEPKPGRQFAGFTETRYVIPDVTVEKVDGDYVVLVNESSTPRLTLSPYYQKMLAESDKESNISQFLTGRLNSAVWLIRSIEQRKQTIFNVVSAVVKYQKDFFDYGPKYLKTLTLKQIADEVGIHESTVSRSINGKYMQSPRGIFEIKYFFTSGVNGSSGEGIASQSIKALIREIVDNEDPRAPKSDQAMVEILKEKGIDISRRTVAKYRDEMHVASSSKRKRY